MCDYFWCLLNKIGWCTWGTTPFAYRIIVGNIYNLHFKFEFKSQQYLDDTDAFHSLFLEKDYDRLQAYYDLHKDKYKGSVE